MRRVLILILAMVAGLSTFVILESRKQVPQPIPQSETERETVHVLVFANDLLRGTLLDEDALLWQEHLLSSSPEGGFTSVTGSANIPISVLGKLLRRDVVSGEPVRPWLLVDGSAGFMALTISSGKRAVAIPITTQKLAGGFILPDDRVDVIHTSNRSQDSLQGILSQTILENLRVLAIGTQPASKVTLQTAEQQSVAARRQNDVVLTGDTITLEVSDTEAEILLSALLTGQVSLALRALDDHGPSRIGSTIGLETASSAAHLAAVAAVASLHQSDQLESSAQPFQRVNEAADPVQDRQHTGRLVRIIGGGTAPRLIDVPASRNETAP